MTCYVYIAASRPHGTLYVGVTNDLVRRVFEHRGGVADGFTGRHGVKCLVYFEMHADIEEAIKREKSLKRWRRAWKIALVEGENPQWVDLWGGLSRWPIPAIAGIARHRSGLQPWDQVRSESGPGVGPGSRSLRSLGRDDSQNR